MSKAKTRRYCSIAVKFISEISSTLSPCTVIRYKSLIDSLYRWAIDEYQISPSNVINTLDRDTIHKYILRLNYLNQNTKIQYLVSLRFYFIWLYENHYTDIDPYVLIKKTDVPRKIKNLPKPLDPETDKKLITYLESSKNVYDKAFLLLRLTGLRISELLNLSYDCVKEVDEGKFALKVPAGKTKEERLVPLNQKVIDTVAFIKNYKNCSSVENNSNSLLLAFGKKDTVDTSTMRMKFKKICKTINLDPKIHIHQMRHTYATALLNAGMDIVFVARCLGHKDLRMTMRYCKITINDILEQYYKAIDNIDARDTLLSKKTSNGNTISDLNNTIKKLEKLADETKNFLDLSIVKKNVRRLKIVLKDFEKSKIDF